MYSRMNSDNNNEAVISCRNAGKCYKIYNSPKDRLKQAIWGKRRRYYREFWALKDVSFELRKGDSLGVIGRNGSGKSTLLQLVCGTVSPTEGSVKTYGRVAALLELGSGFNPEFTGIENVYLNASMLGLCKEQIETKFDDILGFADIGEFINQPVKTYSSGMTVRLAFAVIANVNADILVVDEALAVGDAIFVQRCMRYIKRMRDERCLVFVSHDAEAVKSLCSKSLWLSNGRIMSYGLCKDVCLDYLRFCNAEISQESIEFKAIGKRRKETKDLDVSERVALESLKTASTRFVSSDVCSIEAVENLSAADGWSTGGAELVSVCLMPAGCEGVNTQPLRGGEEVVIEITARADITIDRPVIGFTVANRLGQHLFGENTLIARDLDGVEKADPGDLLYARFSILFPKLPSGEYALMASIADGDLQNHIQHHWTENAVIINVSSDRLRYGLVGTFLYHASLRIDKEVSKTAAI